MRAREFVPAVRRRSHRIRIGRIATALSALVALAVPDLTQAQNAPDVGWIFSDVSALNPPKLARFQEHLRELGYVEDKIGNNRADKITSAAGSGGERCEMAPEEFAKFYPPLLNWIRATLAANAHAARSVASRGFSQLPLYFTEKTLASTKVVLAIRCQCHPYLPWG